MAEVSNLGGIDPVQLKVMMMEAKPSEFARCDVCGFQGIYGKEVIDVDYRDINNRTSQRCECRDIDQCLSRRDGRLNNLKR